MGNPTYKADYTSAGLFDPKPVPESLPLPAGLRLLQVAQLACVAAEVTALVTGRQFLNFAPGFWPVLSYCVIAPWEAFNIQRRTGRLRFGAYLFLSLETIRAVRHTFLVPAAVAIPLPQGLGLLAFCLGMIAYLQLPHVVMAVPKVDPREMRRRWMQRFQRTLNG